MVKETKAIKIEARNGVIRNYNNQSARPINEEIYTITNMVKWVKSAIFFKKSTRKVGNRMS